MNFQKYYDKKPQNKKKCKCCGRIYNSVNTRYEVVDSNYCPECEID